MANKNLHPKINKITFRNSVGNEIIIETCLNTKMNQNYRLLDVDFNAHPAWKKNK